MHLGEGVSERTSGTSIIGARAAIAAMMGVMFNGQRDVYDAAGYAKALTFNDYYGAYRRQDVAKRIVAAPPAETWRLEPEILDGTDEKDAGDDTEFAKAVQELASVGDAEQWLVDKPGLFHVLHRLDRVTGIGRYGLLFLGLNDGMPLDEPVQPGALDGPADLLYMTVYSEGNATHRRLRRQSQPRPATACPNTTAWPPGPTQASMRKRVHWTRCIHVAEGVDDDDVFGTPRLEAVWNRLH